MAKKVTKKVSKKRVKKNVERGQAHIQSSFNNTIVTLTDAEGDALKIPIQKNELQSYKGWQTGQYVFGGGLCFT